MTKYETVPPNKRIIRRHNLHIRDCELVVKMQGSRFVLYKIQTHTFLQYKIDLGGGGGQESLSHVIFFVGCNVGEINTLEVVYVKLL